MAEAYALIVYYILLSAFVAFAFNNRPVAAGQVGDKPAPRTIVVSALTMTTPMGSGGV